MRACRFTILAPAARRRRKNPGPPDNRRRQHKIDWTKKGAGDRFGNIELEIGVYNTIITDQQQPTAAARGEELGMSAGAVLNHQCTIGSVDFSREELERRRQASVITV